MSNIWHYLYHKWLSVPVKWRVRGILWLASLTATWLVIRIWGLGVYFASLIIISLVGYFLKRTGFQNGSHADRLLGKVWDYFRGAILTALVPPGWTALQSIVKGDPISGIIQITVLVMIALMVFDKFKQLPRSWSAYANPRKQRRR